MAKDNSVDQVGNEWAGLAAAAGKGEIRFDPKVAATVAAKIINALEQVRNVDRQIAGGTFDMPQGSFGMLPYEGRGPKAGDYQGSGPSPGEKTRTIYMTLASGTLHDSLVSHGKVLDEMLDTYLAIGKMYPAADKDSAAIFDDVTKRQAALADPPDARPPVDAVTLDMNAPTESFTRDLPRTGPKANSHTDADRLDHATIVAADPPTYYGGKSDNKAVTPLDGTQLSYHDLYYLGQTMDPLSVRSIAGFWWQAAGQLYSRFGELKAVLHSDSVTQAWEGAGYKAAVRSMSTYGEQLNTLTGGMYGAHDMLMHVASWMNQVKPQLPQDPTPPETQSVGNMYELQALSSGDAGPYLAAYETDYAPKVVTDPSSYVPHIPQAAPVTTTAAPDSGGAHSPGGSIHIPDTSGSIGGSGALGSAGDLGPLMTERPTNGIVDWSQQGDPQARDTGITGVGPVGDPGGTAGDQTMPPPGTNPMGNPLSQLGQAAQQGLQPMQPMSPSANGLRNLTDAQRAALNKAKSGALGARSGGGVGGVGGGGVKAGELAKEAAQNAKLFPRAAAEAERDALAARAGMAPQGMSPGGYPGGGMGGGQKQGEDKEKKRAEYLSSKRYLEEAFGKPPSVAKPVVEQ